MNKDINLILRKAYRTALATVGCPVYWGDGPDNDKEQSYIVMSAITSSDAATFDKNATSTTIQVKRFHWENKYNPGTGSSAIDTALLQALYPYPSFNLNVRPDGVQILNTTLFNDFEEQITGLGGRKFSDRTFIFSHKILIL